MAYKKWIVLGALTLSACGTRAPSTPTPEAPRGGTLTYSPSSPASRVAVRVDESGRVFVAGMFCEGTSVPLPEQAVATIESGTLYDTQRRPLATMDAQGFVTLPQPTALRRVRVLADGTVEAGGRRIQSLEPGQVEYDGDSGRLQDAALAGMILISLPLMGGPASPLGDRC